MSKSLCSMLSHWRMYLNLESYHEKKKPNNYAVTHTRNTPQSSSIQTSGQAWAAWPFSRRTCSLTPWVGKRGQLELHGSHRIRQHSLFPVLWSPCFNSYNLCLVSGRKKALQARTPRDRVCKLKLLGSRAFMKIVSSHQLEWQVMIYCCRRPEEQLTTSLSFPA